MRYLLKGLLLAVLCSVFITACDKEDPVDVPDNPAFKGDFVSGAHSTQGVATIDQEKTKLTLSNFKTDSGPDLNIYLATSPNNVTANYIDLGDIQGVNGTYTYNLPGQTDYEVYKYVVVWCVAFNVNFGYATLEKQ